LVKREGVAFLARLEKRVRFGGTRREGSAWRWARNVGYARSSVTGDNRRGGCSAVETPIEVITGAFRKVDSPTVQTGLISSQPLARLNAKMKNAIEDEDRAPGPGQQVDGRQ
jgi:hypothetical protein